MDRVTEERRRKATALFMLRVIAVEQQHGIIRPDAETFKLKMQQQAAGEIGR